jgi:hypothetical protein
VVRTDSGESQVVAATSSIPYPAIKTTTENCDVTYYFSLLCNDPERLFSFGIDREAEGCKTPRRNRDIDDILKQVGLLEGFCKVVSREFASYLKPESMNSQREHVAVDYGSLTSHDSIIVPIVPLFEKMYGRV